MGRILFGMFLSVCPVVAALIFAILCIAGNTTGWLSKEMQFFLLMAFCSAAIIGLRELWLNCKRLFLGKKLIRWSKADKKDRKLIWQAVNSKEAEGTVYFSNRQQKIENYSLDSFLRIIKIDEWEWLKERYFIIHLWNDTSKSIREIKIDKWLICHRQGLKTPWRIWSYNYASHLFILKGALQQDLYRGDLLGEADTFFPIKGDDMGSAVGKVFNFLSQHGEQSVLQVAISMFFEGILPGLKNMKDATKDNASVKSEWIEALIWLIDSRRWPMFSHWNEQKLDFVQMFKEFKKEQRKTSFG